MQRLRLLLYRILAYTFCLHNTLQVGECHVSCVDCMAQPTQLCCLQLLLKCAHPHATVCMVDKPVHHASDFLQALALQ